MGCWALTSTPVSPSGLFALSDLDERFISDEAANLLYTARNNRLLAYALNETAWWIKDQNTIHETSRNNLINFVLVLVLSWIVPSVNGLTEACQKLKACP